MSTSKSSSRARGTSRSRSSVTAARVTAPVGARVHPAASSSEGRRDRAEPDAVGLDAATADRGGSADGAGGRLRERRARSSSWWMRAAASASHSSKRTPACRSSTRSPKKSSASISSRRSCGIAAGATLAEIGLEQARFRARAATRCSCASTWSPCSATARRGRRAAR